MATLTGTVIKVMAPPGSGGASVEIIPQDHPYDGTTVVINFATETYGTLTCDGKSVAEHEFWAWYRNPNRKDVKVTAEPNDGYSVRTQFESVSANT